MTEQNLSSKKQERLALKLFITALILFAVIIFFPVLNPGDVLFSTDDHIGDTILRKVQLPAGFLGCWENSHFGNTVTVPINWTNLLLWLLPAEVFHDSIHALDLLIASIFMVFFLRLYKCTWAGCAVAVITAYWTGTNLTLTYAGHTGKYGVLMFCSMALWLIAKSIQTRKLTWSILAGGAMGGMFLEQQDVALFLSLFLGAYAVFSAIRKEYPDIKAIVIRVAPIPLVALLIAGPTMFQVYSSVKQSGVTGGGEQSETRWYFATQWSVPPDEVIDFVAPGFTGWRSDEPEGPYWGRTGRSHGWEKTKQGFRNFRLESIYIGAIPISLAIFALMISLRKNRKNTQDNKIPEQETSKLLTTLHVEEWQTEIWFWTLTALIALLLSFGKYFPLYNIFYQLPGISSIRNPNKFIHMFQIAIGILAGMGLAHVIPSFSSENNIIRRKIKLLAIITSIIGIGMLLVVVFVSTSRGYQEAIFVSKGWTAEFANIIVKNIIRSLTHGAILFFLVTATSIFIIKIQFNVNKVRVAVWFKIVAVIIDSFMLSRHYIKSLNVDDVVGSNIVTRYLKGNLGNERIAFAYHGGFYHHWITITFPYHNITRFDLPLALRLPKEVEDFMTIGRENIIRLWQLSAVKYVICPAQIWQQLRNDTMRGKLFEPVLGFHVYSAGDSIRVEEITRIANAPHLILKFNVGLPKYTLFDEWEICPDSHVHARLTAPSFDPAKMVLVSAETPIPVQSVSTELASISTSKNCSVLQSEYHKIILSTESVKSTILLIIQRYNKRWTVLVDDKPASLLRCNGIFMGVHLPPGKHTVALYVTPEWKNLIIQGIGFFVCGLAAIIQILNKYKINKD